MKKITTTILVLLFAIPLHAATVVGTTTQIDNKNKGLHKTVWTPLTAANAVGDTAGPELGADRTVAVTGTFNSATVVIQGSLDGTNFFTLNDFQGSAISCTAACLEGIAEFVPYIRPSTSGGGGSQSITVTIFYRNPNFN